MRQNSLSLSLSLALSCVFLFLAQTVCISRRFGGAVLRLFLMPAACSLGRPLGEWLAGSRGVAA